MTDKLRKTVAYLNSRGIKDPEIGLILGTGLNDFADKIEDPIKIHYNDVPNMKAGYVSDHRGEIVFGEYLGKRIMIMAGRFHYYENHDMDQTAFPARVLVAMGVKRFIITNAAGCVNTDFQAGSLMLINDHINLSGNNPLIGDNIDEFGPRFPDMTYTYNRDLLDKLKAAAAEKGIGLHEGVYAMFSGPSFETPAEIRFARLIGADAVGMSTVPEAIIANHAGREIIGISFLSNMAAGVLDKPLSGEEVSEAGDRIKDTFSQVVDLAITI
ncbi:MAG: purine-nucleoside phosphorylase [Mogibacterium sp.]|nr:purine-nucleoside phosphorylase [Mogibacterium sp.]